MEKSLEKIFPLDYLSGEKEILPINSIWNAVIVTDLHFSDLDSYFDIRKMPETFISLERIIKMHNAKQMLILGDLFHTTCRKIDFCIEIINKLSLLNVDLYMINGNHDRDITQRLSKVKQFKGTKVCHFVNFPKVFMEMQPKSIIESEKIESDFAKIPEIETNEIDLGNQKNILFTHDAGNGYAIGASEIEDQIRGIRFYQKSFFEKNSFLVTGHTHFLRIAKSDNCASIAPFHVAQDWKSEPRSYAVAKQLKGEINLKIYTIKNEIFK